MIRFILVLILAGAGLHGCREAPPTDAPSGPSSGAPSTETPDASPPADAESRRASAPREPPDAEGELIESNGRTYIVRYWLIPEDVPLNEVFDIEVEVHRASGAPADDLVLSIDGRMPHHRHGMNRVPTVSAYGDGTFSVHGMLFHMPGLWELHFDLTDGALTERAQVDVELE